MTHTTPQPNDVINYEGNYYIVVSKSTKYIEILHVEKAFYYSISKNDYFEILSNEEIKDKFPFLIN